MSVKYQYNDFIALPIDALTASKCEIGSAEDFERIASFTAPRMIVSGVSGDDKVCAAGTVNVTGTGTKIVGSLGGLKGDNAVEYSVELSKYQGKLVGKFTESV